jgi:pimeloyl-[acyl-carrier protein] methyl ester esterase
MFSAAEQARGDDERWIAARSGAQPVAALRAGLDYLRDFSIEPGSVPAPAFLLHGANDAICPLASAERLAAALPHARLTVVYGAGHAPFWTRPDRFRAWLQASR